MENRKNNRRLLRPSWIRDESDPYFIFRDKIKNGEMNVAYADKLELKDLVSDMDGLKISKTLFEFNIDGEIISGEKPHNGKVFLKQTVSAWSNSVMVIESNKIDKNILSKFAKRGYEKNYIDLELESDESEYSSMTPRFFAEEYLEFVPKTNDWSIFTDGTKNFIYLKETPNYENDGVVVTKAYNDDFLPVTNPATLYKDTSPIDENTRLTLKLLGEYALKIGKRVGHFCRVDFYFHNGEVYMGEVTLTPSRGSFYESNRLIRAINIKKNRDNILVTPQEEIKEEINKFFSFIKEGY